MWPRTARFDAAVIAGGAVIVEASVTRTSPGQVPVTVIPDLELLPGSTVTVDGTAGSRRTFKGSVADPTGVIVPKLAADALAPYGNELNLRVGFRYTDGTTETVPVGVFRLDDAQSDTDGKISLTGIDRSSVVAGAAFEQPYVIADGTNLGTAIQDLVASRYPGTLTYNFTGTGLTLPLTVFEEGDRAGDPWECARTLAQNGGLKVYFDQAGACVLAPIPDPAATASVWTHAAGPDALIIGAANQLTAKGVANVVVLTIEGTGQTQPWRSWAEVTDPASPIYPSGAFGRRPKLFLQSGPLITSQAQVDGIAAGLLLQEAGGGEQLTFQAAPHPAHDADDVVLVQSSLLYGGEAYAVLTSFSLDIGMAKPVDYTTAGRRSS